MIVFKNSYSSHPSLAIAAGLLYYYSEVNGMNKFTNWALNHKKSFAVMILILILGIIPGAIELGVCNVPLPGSNDTWINFWGTYLGTMIGSGIAIGGVYWQVNKSVNAEKTISDDQKKDEKEMNFSRERPFFVLHMMEHPFLYGRHYVTSLKNIDRNFYFKLKNAISQDMPISAILLNNVSNKKMMAVKIVLSKKNGKSETFFVDKISAGSQFILIPEDIYKTINNISFVLSEKEKSKIFETISEPFFNSDFTLTIFFTTQVREKVKLYFKYSERIFSYRKDMSKLENQGQNIVPSEYSNSDFQSNEVFHVERSQNFK